jgi:hypothetical protein
MATCAYCIHWTESKVVSRGTSNAIEISRKCPAALTNVQSDSKSCKYFNPKFFYCDKKAARMAFIACLSSRRNEKSFTANDSCKKCRQFDKDIREIVQTYFVDAVQTVIPRHLLKTEEIEPKAEKTKKLKRRKKKETPEAPKKLKRRKKKETSIKEIPKKLKRRKRENV